MAVMLRPVGMLKDYVGGRDTLTVPAGRSVRETLAAVGIPPELVALVVVNEVQESKDYVLQEGDHLRVMALIGGG
ncbi:MAG: MoaD/ThiS family protein [Chloroflexota bacterium]